MCNNEQKSKFWLFTNPSILNNQNAAGKYRKSIILIFQGLMINFFSIHLKCPLFKFIDGFGILNFDHCNLFVICYLIFGIFYNPDSIIAWVHALVPVAFKWFSTHKHLHRHLADKMRSGFRDQKNTFNAGAKFVFIN